MALLRDASARVQANSNLIVQASGLAMVTTACVSVTPWAWVAGWLAMQASILLVEDLLLRRAAASNDAPSAWSTVGAPVLRIGATTLYALAAMTLIVRGGPVERLFAFGLMSVSMVHVLMRYYRSRLVLLLSLSPYMAILSLVAFGQIKLALAHGHALGALVATFTIFLFGVQFWFARAQLAATWTELVQARQGAEEREQAAEAASRAKSSFLATMSHELRTPLNGVLGMAEALTNERLTDAQRERVAIIRRSSESLLAVLNDLLDLSKVESHALELEIGEFDLEQLVRGVVASYEPLASKKGLSFACVIAEAARGAYLGDSARIRRILYSLADNAVKFTEDGGVTLSVDREGGEVVFRFDDSGIGIADDHMGRLFEGFYQADGSLSRRHGGAGLGLAICSELSALMGGGVEAASELGAGSTFIVRLPLAPAPGRAQAPSEPRRRDKAQPRELRVLAAEDNDTNQLVLKTLLAQAGVDITLVENGRAALDAWEAQTWDIILMDIQMPVMDGVAAARAIRDREAATGRARTPILAVTANAMTHQVAEYAAAGIDGMVAKPIDLIALFSAMQAALEPPAKKGSAAQATAAA